MLKNLDISKASGPGGISNKLLKLMAQFISCPLCKLFNMSLQSGKFPTECKKANVTPVFKINNRQDNNNYTPPISLLPCIAKLFECIVFMNIVYKTIYTHGGTLDTKSQTTQ